MAEEIDKEALSAAIGEELERRGWRVAVAESLTGGQVSSCLAAAPSSSEWYLGAVVSYTKQVKFDVLDVPEGPVVNPETAVAMAESVARLTGAEVSAGVTGAGGPDPQDGQEPGTVFVAVRTPDADPAVTEHHYAGDPVEVVGASCGGTLHALAVALGVAEPVEGGS